MASISVKSGREERTLHAVAHKYLVVTIVSIAAFLAAAAGASAATICVGEGTSCGTADYALTEAGFQGALDEAANSSPGHDVIEIGPGQLDLTGAGVVSMPPAGETVAIQGSGTASTVINASLPFNMNPLTLNFQNAPTSTISNLEIEVNASSGWFFTGLLMRNGGTVQSVVFDVNSAAGATYAAGLQMETTATGYTVPPVCSGCEFKLDGPNAQGLRTALYSSHAATVYQSFFERSTPGSDDISGIVSVNSNTTTTVTRGVFSDMTRAVSVELGTVNVRDSFFNLGSMAGAEGVSVEYTNNSAGGRILNGNVDGSTMIGTGANQIGVDVVSNTTNVLHEYGNTDIRSTVFRLTGSSPTDVRCTQSNYGESTITIRNSFVKPTAPTTSGTCTTDIADNVNSATTDPQFSNEGIGDYTPVTGSPLVDGGDAATSQSGRSFDVIGLNRFVNGLNGSIGGRIDIGAFENQGPPPDTTPPVVTITAPTNGSNTSSPTVTLNYTATDNYGDAPTCDKADGSSQPLAIGSNTITVSCQDAANNIGSASVSVTRTDVTPPVVTITAPTNGSTTTATATTLIFTASDNSGETPNCDKTSGASQALAIGANALTVSCTDTANNTGSATVNVTRLDVTSPVVTITSPVHESSTVSATANLVFSATDNSGQTPTCNYTSGSAVPLNFGPNTIVVTCQDASGNTGQGEVDITRIDATPPVITITAPANNFVTDQSSVVVNFTRTDDSGQTPSCNRTSGASQALNFGLNVITVTCIDGNSNSASVSVNVTRVNDAAPVVTIHTPTNGSSTTAASVELTYTALDGLGNPATCDIPSGSTIPLNVGSNTITVTCQDPSENVGGASVTVTRTDGIPPVVSISAPTDGTTTTAGSVILNFTATDNSGDTPTCNKVNGSSQALAIGSNTITVSCTDSSNNSANASVTVTRTDVTGPVVTITNPVHGGTTTSASTTLNFTAVDDSGATPSCNETSGSVKSLAFGANSFTVTCTDAANNSGSATATVTRLDNTPPVITISSPTNGLETNATSVTLNFTATDDSGATPTCDATTGSTVGLNFGPNTITVQCQDGSSNTGTASVSVTRTDVVPPVVDISSPTTGTSTNAAVTTLFYTATDNSGSPPTCNLENGSTQPLAFGLNTITVSCTDASNNAASDSVTVTRIDDAPPVITITAPTNGSSTSNASTTLTFTATDNSGATPTCNKTSGSTEPLAFGSNTITVSCQDGSSNSASASTTVTRLDVAPPVITITAPENGLNTNATEVVLSYTVTDNSGATPSCDKPSGSTQSLNFGPNTITVNCTDGSNNTGSASVAVNRFDNSPPVVTISAPTNGASTTNATIAVSYTAVDNSGSAPSCNFASGSNRPLSFGLNTITVSCTDASNNTGTATVNVTRLDNTPPVVTISTPTNGSSTTNASVTLNFTATDDSGATPNCDKTNGGSQPLGFGANTIVVNCTDGSNNTGSASVSVTRLDNVAPVITISAPANNTSTNATEIAVSYTVTDNTGATPVCNFASGSLRPLNFGPNTLTVSCTDASNNTGTASVNVNRNDADAPVVNITSPTEGASTTASTIVVTYTATDNSGSAPTCNFASGSSRPLVLGSNTITVSCADASNNTGTASVSVTRLDNTPPVISITAPSNNSSTTNANAVLLYTATDNSGATPTCDKPSGSSQPLVFGANTITVSCQDAASNSSSASVNVSRLDSVAPVVTITAPFNGSSTTNASVALTFTATDNTGETPTCDKTSGASQPLSIGSNTLTVSCEDSSDNVGSASVTITRLDNTPPVVTISSPTDGSSTSNTSVTLNFTATDNSGATPTCNKANGSSQTLAFGPNTISVSCTDAANNIGSASVSVTRLDTAPPVVTITSPANGSSTAETELPVTYTVTDNSGAAPSCDATSGAIWPLSMGSNTYAVSCTDASNNTGTASITVTRTTDPPPVVTITSPTNGSTTSLASIPVNFSVTDNADPNPNCTPASGSSVPLTLGANTITVTCTDDQGGVTIQSISVTRADNTAPVITISSPVSGSTVATSSVSVNYTVADNSGVAPTCNPANGSSRNLFPGPNVITVSCTDQAGNTGTKQATVTYDTAGPGTQPPPPAENPPTTARSISYVRAGTPKFKRTGLPFSAGAPGATTVLTASVTGSLTIKLQLTAIKGGYKNGKKCLPKKPKKGKKTKCNMVIKGSQLLPMTAGNWMIDWGGKFGGKTLPAGSYTLTSTIVETNAITKFNIALVK